MLKVYKDEEFYQLELDSRFVDLENSGVCHLNREMSGALQSVHTTVSDEHQLSNRIIP